jgi:hypothetical protein
MFHEFAHATDIHHRLLRFFPVVEPYYWAAWGAKNGAAFTIRIQAVYEKNMCIYNYIYDIYLIL